ncbi:MAG: beta-ketoacyl-ACP synthase III [Actinocatenispora sp.]
MKVQDAPAPSPATILGVGGYLPERVVPNTELCDRIGVSDDWIVQRSGIRQRRFAAPDENIAVMGHAAATKALASAGIDPVDVDCVIAATMTHLRQAPAVAAEIADLLGTGANVAAAFDLSAGCAGFCYAVNVAKDMIASGSAKHVLVVGTERMSDIIDPEDRGSAFLFGDGAGAVVIGPGTDRGIGPVVWGSDSARSSVISQPRDWTELKDEPGGPFPYLQLAGPTVFRWAVTEMGQVAQRALDAAGVGTDELSAMIPHQANLRITDALAEKLDLPDSVVVSRDIADIGNTSAASIPLAMERLLARDGGLSGGNALLIGFGAGLLYAAQVVKLP